MIKTFLDTTITPLFNTILKSEPDYECLEDKVIVITGGSKGLGNKTAEIMLKEKAKVIIVARNTKGVEAQFKDNPDCLCIAGDIAQQDDVSRIFKRVIQQYGRIDVLINNAGMFLEKPIDEIQEPEFNAVIDSNLKGAFLMTSTFLAAMKKQKSGTIINIGSKISHNTNIMPNKVLYAMTKYALEGFSYALHKELKPYGIRVVCLMPGTMKTFSSIHSGNFLATEEVIRIIAMIIILKNVDFESIIIKSRFQNI